MKKQSVSTFSRFVYLNLYAFLLCMVGIGILFIPLSSTHWILFVLQIILSIVCVYGGINIFNTWKTKKRKYDILWEKNVEGIRHESFSDYMQAPCGRLLVKIVLKDLDKSETYSELQKYRTSFCNEIKNGYKPQKTIIRININQEKL